jgi:hypothetical protein
MRRRKKEIYFGVFSSRPYVPLVFWMGPPLEAHAVFHICNINNNKLEHEIKNNKGEEYIKINSLPHLLFGSGFPHPPTPHTLDHSISLHIGHLPRRLLALRPLALRPLALWPFLHGSSALLPYRAQKKGLMGACGLSHDIAGRQSRTAP